MSSQEPTLADEEGITVDIQTTRAYTLRDSDSQVMAVVSAVKGGQVSVDDLNVDVDEMTPGYAYALGRVFINAANFVS